MTLHSAPDPPSAGVAIEAKDLEKAFGEVPAVRGLNLNVRKGESLGLLGPNGAGKTTTLRILSTLLPADGGSVRVLGLDPAKDGRALRARIGVVPQDIALYAGLRAEENLRLFGELAGLGGARLRERVEWGLEAAGLEERRRSLVSEFSGGMKRRLNLVAALLHEPELVFLDEPTAGVDPQSRNHLFEQVEAIHRAGTTLVYTTHAMGEVERLCGRIVIMDRGRCLAEGTLEGLRGLDAVRAGLGTGLQMEPGVDLEQAAAVLREHGMGAEVRGVAADLESIFLALTGRALRDENVEDDS
ncbi:MAG: ABC transporter ATP-binding protein [Planctomycetota bacterium]|nr:ABC transporter ATP-binding protein [Planctomycetota bacterium]MDG1984405.1 ABC transporter ATP-binding protein [Planctomycetota bacterium]